MIGENQDLTTSFFKCVKIDPLSALDLFISRGVKKATIAIDQYRLYPFCSQHRNTPIQDIASKDIDDWVEELQMRLSCSSVESYKQTMKRFFNWCVQNPSIPLEVSPARHLRPQRRTSARYKAANEKDLDKVISGLQNQIYVLSRQTSGKSKLKLRHVVRDLLAYRLALESGKRLNELATVTTHAMRSALKHPQMARNGKVVYVAKSHGKTGFADLQFTEYTAAIYNLWVEIRPKGSTNFVFVGLGGLKSGEPLTTNGFTHIFQRRSKEYGIPVYRTHSIRHLKGTKVTDDFNPRVAASVLNINVETVMHHYYNQDYQDTIDAIAI
ncbi:MAG: tyrosine-type recombinase/integrase [Chloroflexota bacterium]|jgi:integrase